MSNVFELILYLYSNQAIPETPIKDCMCSTVSTVGFVVLHALPQRKKVE